MSKTISARIDNSLQQKLVEQCNKEGKQVSEKVEEILRQALDDSSTCSSTIDTQETIIDERLNAYKQKNNEISEKIDQISQAVKDIANEKATKNEVNSLRQELDKIPKPFHRGLKCYKESEFD